MSEECICVPPRGCCCISFCIGELCHCKCTEKIAALEAKLAAYEAPQDDGEVEEALKFAEGGCSIEPTDERIERILATALRQSQALVKEMAEALKVADHALEVAGFQDIQPIRACVRAALLSAGKEK